MADRPRVFISYVSSDAEKAHEVAMRLSENDILVYSDELLIGLDNSLFSTIRNQIATSDYLVLILSQDSLRAGWGQVDLEYAIQKDWRQRSINLIPLKIGQFKVPEFISSQTVIDASRNFEKGIEKLIVLLRSAPLVNLESMISFEFEEFACDFLRAYGYRTVKKPRFSNDFGYDFSATYTHKDPFGHQETVEWIIEIKAQKSKTDISVLNSFLGALSLRGENTRGLFMTAGQLTTPASDWLEHMRRSGKPQILVLDGPEIKRLTLAKPKLVAKHFGRVGDE